MPFAIDPAAWGPGGPIADGLSFAALTPSDEPELARFFEESADPETVASFHPFPLTADTATRLATKPGADHYYLARRSGALVAFSMLRGWDHGYDVPSFGLVVGPAARGHGVGHRLTTWTIDQARTLGCPAVRLTVYADNVPAVHVYEALGFEDAGPPTPTSDGRLRRLMIKRFPQQRE